MNILDIKSRKLIFGSYRNLQVGNRPKINFIFFIEKLMCRWWSHFLRSRREHMQDNDISVQTNSLLKLAVEPINRFLKRKELAIST